MVTAPISMLHDLKTTRNLIDMMKERIDKGTETAK